MNNLEIIHIPIFYFSFFVFAINAVYFSIFAFFYWNFLFCNFYWRVGSFYFFMRRSMWKCEIRCFCLLSLRDLMWINMWITCEKNQFYSHVSGVDSTWYVKKTNFIHMWVWSTQLLKELILLFFEVKINFSYSSDTQKNMPLIRSETDHILKNFFF